LSESTQTANGLPDAVLWPPERVIGRWPWIVLGGIAGALVALALSTSRTPVYDASAAMEIGIDYPRTAPLDLLAENRVLDRVAALVTSDDTLALVADRLDTLHGPQPAWSTPAALRSHVRLDRKAATWEYVGYADTPDAAAAIADAWLDVSLSELDEAMAHAWETLKVQSAVAVLACSGMSTGATADSFWECLATGPVLTEQQVSALREELALSRGILPIVSYHKVRAATASEAPVVWDRGPLVVGGAVAGMAAGVVLALVVLPAARQTRGRREQAAVDG